MAARHQRGLDLDLRVSNRFMSNQAITYAEVQRTLMGALRAAHPEWEEEVFDSYEARIVTLFKLLESKQEFAAVTF